MADAHANFAYGTVLTAPSPATSGTSLVLNSGQGALMPAVPFNATVWPVSSQPTAANAEIVRVTAISTDTLTITRAQEGTSARTVVVGDQIAATITKQTITDIEGTVAAPAITGITYRVSSTSSSQTAAQATGLMQGRRILLSAGTLDRIMAEHVASPTASELCRLGIYNDSNGRPGTLLLDAGTIDLSTSAALKQITISQAVTTGWYWLVATRQGPTNTATMRCYENSNQNSGFSGSGMSWAQINTATFSQLHTPIHGVATISSITGSLPTPFGTVVTAAVDGTQPIVGVRYA